MDLNKIPGTIIAVNNAALHAPRIDIVISMDRVWADTYWPWIKERGDAGTLRAWLRESSARNIQERPEWLTVYRCDNQSPVMTDESGALNGTNSGGCALNLAYRMKPKKVFLFGFDYRRGPKNQNRWFEETGTTGTVGAYAINKTKYAAWAHQYDAAAAQFKAAGIDVVNVSETSLVSAFRKVSPAVFNKVYA